MQFGALFLGEPVSRLYGLVRSNRERKRVVSFYRSSKDIGRSLSLSVGLPLKRGIANMGAPTGLIIFLVHTNAQYEVNNPGDFLQMGGSIPSRSMRR